MKKEFKNKFLLNFKSKYRLTSGTFIRLAVLAAIIIAVVFAPKLRNLFDHSLKNDLSSNKLNNPQITRSFFILPAYGVTRNKEQYQFESENEKIKVNLSQNYSGPIEIKLSDSQSVKIFDQNSSNFKSELLKSLDTSKNKEQNKYVKYKSKDKRKIIYYSYQKDAKRNQKKLKNWIVYKSGTGEENESYKIENAIISPYQNGSVAVYYSDKLTDEKKNSDKEKKAKTPDFIIDRPYYFTKDGKTTELDWKVNQEKNEISLQFKAEKEEYPITLDPTITHNSEAQFDGGTALNRTESSAGPKVQSAYHELPADEHTVALYHMNETINDSCSGGQDVCDSSGNGNHGTATGTTIETTDQKLGAAARAFNGTSDYISVSNNSSMNMNGALTVETWFKTSTASRRILVKEPSGGGVTNYSLQIDASGYLNGGVYDGTNNPTFSNTAKVVTNGNWHHAALTRDGTYQICLYIDGIQQCAKDTTVGNTITNSSSLIIGNRNGSSSYFSGLIDEVRISNVARTPEEIKANAQHFPYGIYNSSVLNFPSNTTSLNDMQWSEYGVKTSDGETLKDDTGLVAQWNFNETSGTTAANNAGSCGSSCNGTLTSFASTGSQDAAAGTGWTADNRRWGAGALMFDGTDDYVNAGSSPSISNITTKTFCTWIYLRSQIGVDSMGSHIINKGDHWFIATDPANSRNIYGQNFSTQGRWSFPLMQAGQWNHLCVIYDKSSANNNPIVYVNSVAQPITEYSTPEGTASDDSLSSLSLGSSIANGRWLNGSLDAVQLYSRALSAEEILSNYNAGNIDIQTRTGTTTNPDDGSWETWKPAGTETQIDSMDSDAANWSWDNTSTYIPATTANESNIKMEGTGSMKIQTGSPNADANTVGLWHLDETDVGVGATVYDSSGNGNHGTLSGSASTTDGRVGKGRNFDGGSRIGLGNNSTLNPTSAITIETWFKASSFGSYNPLVSKSYTDGSWSSPYVVYLLRIDSNNSIVWGTTSSGGSYNQYTFGYTFTPGVWYYLAVTSNGSNKYVYVNGQQVTSTGWAYSLASRTSNAYIGGSDGGDRFNGLIDEVRISNIARTPEEIAEAYRSGRDHRISRTISSTDLSSKNKLPFYVAADRPGTYIEATAGESAFANGEPDANTVGLWHLEEATGTSAYLKDSSDNGNHGTPTGTTFAEGKIGKARSFNGSSDYVDVSPVSASIAANHTRCAWIKTQQSTSGQIIDTGDATNNYGAYLAVGTGKVLVGGNIGAGYNFIYSSNLVNDGIWHYVCSVFTGGNSVLIYIDGSLDNVGTVNYQVGNYNTIIGKNHIESIQFFSGIIDEPRISNIARTAEEIRQAYEVGRRTHPITIDFAASLDSGNLIVSTADTSFTINSQTYGSHNKGDNIYVGDKIIVKENYDGTEYMAQGTVTSVNSSTGAITIQSWDSGSTAPSGGYTTGAVLFKWQREFWDITGPMDDQIDAVTKLTIRQTDGNEGRTIYLDDFKSLDNYLTDPTASGNFSSTFNRYLQYRTLFSTNDTNVSPYMSSISAYYLDPYNEKNLYKDRGNVQMRGNVKAH